MLSYISAGKSSPNWLDRLRASKGLPTANALDLEHFLSSNPESNSDSISEQNYPQSNSVLVPLDEKPVSGLKKTAESQRSQKHRSKEDWYDIMSSVLSDLFIMGDSSEFQRVRGFEQKKSARKQPNPKFCVLSASASVDLSLNGVRRGEGVPAMSPSSADNSVAEGKETGGRLKPKKERNVASVTVEEDKSQTDVKGYSRVDVMIIDTSAPTWKSEKKVFRKGNVWKVRDKKSKSRKLSMCRKKRKANQFDGEDDEKKKRKKKKQKLSLPLQSSSKEAGQEERIIRSNKGFPPNDTREACKETRDNLSQVPKKRRPFSRSPRKPAKRDAVFHVQGVSTSKKNGVHLPKSCLKDSC